MSAKNAKSPLLVGLVAGALLAGAGASDAKWGTLDDVPAATLLLPYFQIDLTGSGGKATVHVVNQDLTGGPVTAHAVLWTNASVPTIAFDLYLDPFEVAKIDLEDLFKNGNLPQTPTTDTPPTGCSFTPAALSPSALQDLVNAHTGQGSGLLGGSCGGVDPGDGLVRGYLTIDVVNNCSVEFPSESGYFAPFGEGMASNRNVIMGDAYQREATSDRRSQAENLVHIEAALTSMPPSYTFYGRYVANESFGADGREPLASQFSVPYLNQLTDIIVWRDSGVEAAPFACGSPPAWIPLCQDSLQAFDYAGVENTPTVACTAPPFPYETNRVRAGSAALPLSPKRGSMLLDLDTTVTGAFLNPFKQAFVQVVHRVHPEEMSGGANATPLDNLSDEILPLVRVPPSGGGER